MNYKKKYIFLLSFFFFLGGRKTSTNSDIFFLRFPEVHKPTKHTLTHEKKGSRSNLTPTFQFHLNDQSLAQSV